MKNCLGYFNNWSNWTGQHPEISALPEKETYIVIYLLNLFQTGKSYSTINLAYQTINYFHLIAGHPKPCDSVFWQNILEGIKRTIKYAVQKKSSITVKHLYKLYSHFRDKLMSLPNLRTMLICVFFFMGF